MTTLDVRSRRCPIYAAAAAAAAAAEKITLRLHRGRGRFPGRPPSGYTATVAPHVALGCPGRPMGSFASIRLSARSYDRRGMEYGLRLARRRRRRTHAAAHAYFVHGAQFGFMKTLIAALLVNRAFSSAKRTASEIAVRFLLQN